VRAGETTPTFSVIIAAYQAAAFVGTAVASALEQVPPPLEVIVGDDGSTDDLNGALAPFGARVRVVRIAHGGEAAAKNAAAGAATGDFLAFLDADDRFLPERLARIGALACERPDLDVITTDAYLVYDGEIVGRCYSEGHRFEEDAQRESILARNFVLGLAAVRRARFEAVGGFDTSIGYTTDWDLWIRLILTGSEVGFVPEPLAEYRLHEASMSARRAAMSRGRLDTLARAAARDDLSAAERSVVTRTCEAEEALLAREELRVALLEDDTPAARRAARVVARSSRQPLATRLKAVVSMLVPSRARRRLEAEERGSFATVGDRRLPRR
jgi:glycosyltransferase involved in cell wall biosynthesis